MKKKKLKKMSRKEIIEVLRKTEKELIDYKYNNRPTTLDIKFREKVRADTLWEVYRKANRLLSMQDERHNGRCTEGMADTVGQLLVWMEREIEEYDNNQLI